MRGEHQETWQTDIKTMGSSPHARGTHAARFTCVWELGIIPACAGNTWPILRSRRVRRDHPRMRGEHPNRNATISLLLGSSPHARGTPVEDVDVALDGGIIPACAGNTFDAAFACAVDRDHPRMRGEHRLMVSRSSFSPGSSPHARGTPAIPQHSLRIVGIIPACAGNTRRRCRTAWRNGDHPRMRGEHSRLRFSSASCLGSSPHARGTRWRLSP